MLCVIFRGSEIQAVDLNQDSLDQNPATSHEENEKRNKTGWSVNSKKA